LKRIELIRPASSYYYHSFRPVSTYYTITVYGKTSECLLLSLSMVKTSKY